MPAIRFVTHDGVRTVDADRVVSDSQVFVAERRENGRSRARVPRMVRQGDAS